MRKARKEGLRMRGREIKRESVMKEQLRERRHTGLSEGEKE